MASLLWTDAQGTAALRSPLPYPARGLMSWMPLEDDAGERATALGTGAVALFAFRTDFGASFEIRGLTPHAHAGLVGGTSSLALATRLVRHLRAGGTVALVPTNEATPFYSCILYPGSDPSLTMTDAARLEYTLALALKNLGGAPIPYPYARTLAAGEQGRVTALAYRLRVRDAADTADALVVSTVQGVGQPWLAGPPTGDGTSVDPWTGAVVVGGFRGQVIDAETGGGARVLTAVIDDAGGRAALIGNRALWEERVDAGAWTPMVDGYLTDLSLGGALVWDVAVGEPGRATVRAQAFAPRVTGRNTETGDWETEDYPAFFARWPRRGALVGGPITAPPGPSYGPAWLGVNEDDTLRLKLDAYSQGGLHVRGKVAGGDRRLIAGTGGKTAEAELVRVARERTRGYYREGGSASLDRFPDLIAVVRRRQDAGAGWTLAPRLHAIVTPTTQVSGEGRPEPSVIDTVGNLYLATQSLDGRTLAPNDVIDVSIITRFPSAESPLYYTEHPVDLAVYLGQTAGLAYDTASVEAARAAIGADVRISDQVTGSTGLAAYVARAVYGPFRHAPRPAPGGEWALVDLSTPRKPVPTVTVETAHLLDPGTPLELSAGGAYTAVEFKAKQFIFASAPGAAELVDGEAPADGVLVRETTYQRTTGNDARVAARTLAIDVPGMIHVAGTTALSVDSPTLHETLATNIAREVTDRAGAAGRIGLRRGAPRPPPPTVAQIGDEIIAAAAHHVNANRRMRDAELAGSPVPGRAVQVVQRTPTVTGATLEVVDSGALAQAPVVTPTLSLAVVSGGLFGQYAVTVTNKAALDAAGVGVTIQQATTPTASPPGAGAGAAVAIRAPGDVPSGPVNLPLLTNGLYPWVRARATAPGRRAGPYGPWIGTGGAGSSTPITALNPPASVAAPTVPGDGTRLLVTWTTGSNAAGALSDVWVRLASEAAGTERRVSTYAPGSTRGEVGGLTPGTSYTVLVSHRDPTTGSESVRSAHTGSTDAETPTLAAPTDPTPYVVGNGVAGLGVHAVTTPGGAYAGVRGSIAAESGSGTGAFGTFADSPFVVPGAPNGWTRLEIGGLGEIPNDGRTYQLRARSEVGDVVSPWTSAVLVNPWGAAVPLPDAEGGPVIEATARCIVTVASTATQTVATVRTAPAGGTVRLELATTVRDAGPALGVDAPDGTVWIFPRAPLTATGIADDDQAEFSATVDGATDVDVIVIPAQGVGTVPLLLRVAQISADDVQVTYRATASAPGPDGLVRAGALTVVSVAGTPDGTIFVGGLGSVGPGASAALGVTLVDGTTGTGLEVQFAVARPAAGEPPARVGLRVTAEGCTPDLDAVDVAPQATATGPAGPPGAAAPGAAFDAVTLTNNYPSQVIEYTATLAAEWAGAVINLTVQEFSPTLQTAQNFTNVGAAGSYSPNRTMLAAGTGGSATLRFAFTAVSGDATSAPYVATRGYTYAGPGDQV